MITGSVPTCCDCQRHASSLTAIPARIFSRLPRSAGNASLSAYEESAEAWYVATIGPVAMRSAAME